MSFNVGEANSFHFLLRWLLPATDPYGRDPVTDDQAREALAYLAERSRKAMLAGPSGDEVRAAWPPPRCSHCADQPAPTRTVTSATTTGDRL